MEDKNLNEFEEKRIPVEERIRTKKLPYKLPIKLCQLLDGFKWAIHSRNQSAVMVVDGRSEDIVMS